LLVPAYFSMAVDIEQWIAKHFHKLVGDDAHRTPAAVPAE
jgi:hypothetical protein